VQEGLPHPRRHPRHARQRGAALDSGQLTAVILAGGQGTRLRPLTYDRPKPIVPLLNVPFLAYQLALLKRHGVTDVVLSCSYMVEQVEQAMGDGRRWGVRLRYAVEREPLGTAGGVRNAVDLVGGGLVVVLNGDVLTDADLGAMLRFHRAAGSRASLYLTPVPDPSAYGLVELGAKGQILRFIEKPSPDQITTNTINAGAYLLDRELLARIPTDRAVSIEREFFPGLLADGIPFYGWVAGHYWLDIGSPAKYRQGQVDLLGEQVVTDVTPPGVHRDGHWLGADARVDPGAHLYGAVVVGAGCHLAKGAKVGPYAVLGDGCQVAANAIVEGAILWEQVAVGEGALVKDCLVGARARIGARAQVGAGAVLESDAVVPEGARLPA
jgi:NDP-sugar pyrophosphorylase family protein